MGPREEKRPLLVGPSYIAKQWRGEPDAAAGWMIFGGAFIIVLVAIMATAAEGDPQGRVRFALVGTGIGAAQVIFGLYWRRKRGSRSRR